MDPVSEVEAALGLTPGSGPVQDRVDRIVKAIEDVRANRHELHLRRIFMRNFSYFKDDLKLDTSKADEPREFVQDWSDLLYAHASIENQFRPIMKTEEQWKLENNVS